MSYELHLGDCRNVLTSLPDEFVQTVVTSPPYWNLRDYEHAEQIGLEITSEQYVTQIVHTFREINRVLKNNGTIWINLGDTYYKGQKSKNLAGIPWRVALALQSDGWYLRQDIIWHKPNPMPESIIDRCTRAHEYIFLLSKQKNYYFDHQAMQEPQAHQVIRITNRSFKYHKKNDAPNRKAHSNGGLAGKVDTGFRNKRSVWTVATRPLGDAHFATFPPALIEPCILAGSKPGDVVLDPFSGAGTTGVVSVKHGRRYIGIELNPEYLEMSRRRIDAAMQLPNGGQLGLDLNA